MLIHADPLRQFVRDIVSAGGSRPDEAAEVARHLVEANLKGHDSHGVGMIPSYVRALGIGHLRPNVELKTVKELGPIGVFDGGQGYGQVMARAATAWAAARAKETGLGLFGLRNTHHVGRVGTYGEQAAAEGLVSIFFVNVLIVPGRVAPFGGIGGRLGTDPICITFPGQNGTPPFVLDFATSRVAAGKVRVALNEKKAVPTGWIIDAEGKDSTNPGTFFGRSPADGGGALLPFGEHKGSGLAVACELLAGVLAGAGAMHEGVPNRGVQNGMFAILIDPANFAEPDWLEGEMARLIGWVKSSPPRPGTDAVLVAGEPERIAMARRLADGIPIDDTTWGEMVAAAKDAGVPVERIP
jgi:hydroxycarboxylate dehydrogenase B